MTKLTNTSIYINGVPIYYVDVLRDWYGKLYAAVRWCGALSYAAVFKLGSADQRGSATGSHGVRERIPKSSNCLHGF